MRAVFPNSKQRRARRTPEAARSALIKEATDVGEHVSTKVKGEVVETHFECDTDSSHEVSILAARGVELVSFAGCVVDGCDGTMKRKGENPAEVSKDPADLLTN
jgi:hypothetical protein